MNKAIPECIRPILEEVKRVLIGIYGDNLKKIILYGSYARGDADQDSDIDIVIVLRNMKDICEEIDRISNAIGEIDLRHDILVSVIPVTEKEFRSRRMPLILNVKREGIVV